MFILLSLLTLPPYTCSSVLHRCSHRNVHTICNRFASEAPTYRHVLTVITTLHMYRGSSVWNYTRRNNLSSPIHCLSRQVERPPQSTSEPLLAPASFDVHIMDLWIFYTRAMLLAVFSGPALWFFKNQNWFFFLVQRIHKFELVICCWHPTRKCVCGTSKSKAF